MQELLLIASGVVLGVSMTATAIAIIRPTDEFWDGYANAFNPRYWRKKW